MVDFANLIHMSKFQLYCDLFIVRGIRNLLPISQIIQVSPNVFDLLLHGLQNSSSLPAVCKLETMQYLCQTSIAITWL